MQRIVEFVKGQDARRLLILVFVLALVLRVVCAIITSEVLMEKEIFPDYYFSDSYKFHEGALALLEGRSIFAPLFSQDYSPGHAFYTRITAFFYVFFGPHFTVMMVVNSIVSSLVVFMVFKMGKCLYNEKTGLLAGLIYAVFPSIVFWGSQHMRDALIALFNLMAILSVLRMLGGGNVVLNSLVFLSSLFIAGSFRPQIIVFMLSALCVSSLLLLPRKKLKDALKTLWLATLSFFNYKTVPRALSPPQQAFSLLHIVDSLVALRHRFIEDNLNSLVPPQTILFAGWKPSSLLDFAAMEAKLIFYVLFMPLPFIYSVDGRLGRALGAVENSVFLLFFLLGVYGVFLSFRRQHPVKPSVIFLSLYFLFFVSIYAFFAPDLGSAMRYKLQYMPVLAVFISYGVIELWQKLRSST